MSFYRRLGATVVHQAGDTATLQIEPAELLGTVDRAEWIIPPQTINAGYIPTTNEIVFPAAIMQAPLFDEDEII